MLNNKKEIESFLLGWAIGAIMFSFSMAYIIGVIDKDYKEKIQKLEQTLTTRTN